MGRTKNSEKPFWDPSFQGPVVFVRTRNVAGNSRHAYLYFLSKIDAFLTGTEGYSSNNDASKQRPLRPLEGRVDINILTNPMTFHSDWVWSRLFGLSNSQFKIIPKDETPSKFSNQSNSFCKKNFPSPSIPNFPTISTSKVFRNFQPYSIPSLFERLWDNRMFQPVNPGGSWPRPTTSPWRLTLATHRVRWPCSGRHQPWGQLNGRRMYCKYTSPKPGTWKNLLLYKKYVLFLWQNYSIYLFI